MNLHEYAQYIAMNGEGGGGETKDYVFENLTIEPSQWSTDSGIYYTLSQYYELVVDEPYELFVNGESVGSGLAYEDSGDIYFEAGDYDVANYDGATRIEYYGEGTPTETLSFTLEHLSEFPTQIVPLVVSYNGTFEEAGFAYSPVTVNVKPNWGTRKIHNGTSSDITVYYPNVYTQSGVEVGRFSTITVASNATTDVQTIAFGAIGVLFIKGSTTITASPSTNADGTKWKCLSLGPGMSSPLTNAILITLSPTANVTINVSEAS